MTRSARPVLPSVGNLLRTQPGWFTQIWSATLSLRGNLRWSKHLSCRAMRWCCRQNPLFPFSKGSAATLFQTRTNITELLRQSRPWLRRLRYWLRHTRPRLRRQARLWLDPFTTAMWSWFVTAPGIKCAFRSGDPPQLPRRDHGDALGIARPRPEFAGKHSTDRNRRKPGKAADRTHFISFEHAGDNRCLVFAQPDGLLDSPIADNRNAIQRAPGKMANFKQKLQRNFIIAVQARSGLYLQHQVEVFRARKRLLGDVISPWNRQEIENNADLI